VIAKMATFVKNQEKLSNLLFVTQPASATEKELAKQEYYDENDFIHDSSVQTEPLETVIIKEEQMFADEDEQVKPEEPPDDCEVIAVEDSSDDEIIEVSYKKQRRKAFARLPKPKKVEPESERFCPYDECQKLFSSKRVLNAHIESVHDKIKKFRCKLSNCGYSSYHRNNVVVHQINVHKLPNSKTYFCEICGSQFPSSNNLRLHRISKHQNIKNYQCGKFDLVQIFS
jgi:Zinc-finger of C2H2 type